MMKRKDFDISRAKRIVSIATGFSRSSIEIVSGMCVKPFYYEYYVFAHKEKGYSLTIRARTIEIGKITPTPTWLKLYRKGENDPLKDRLY